MTAADATPFGAMTPHPLQLRVVAVPFWGLPAPSPLAAAPDDATFPATTAMQRLSPDITATVATSGSATAVASAPDDGMSILCTATAATTANNKLCTNSTATASASATDAANAIATGAIATIAAGGMTTDVPLDKSPAAKLLHTAHAEQAAASAATVESRETHLSDSDAKRQQRPRFPCDLIKSLAPAFATSSTVSSQHMVADKQAADSLARKAMANMPGATAAKEAQPRGSRKRIASAEPTAARMVNRSQAAAQKHVQRMQKQYQKRH